MKMQLKRVNSLLFVFIFLVAFLSGCSGSQSATSTSTKTTEKPKKIRLDYAYYSPVSLVLKEKGWVEEEFKKEGIQVEYVLSQGSNKALEFLNSNSIDFGSTAGGAALIAKAKGNPLETIYISSNPEWTALLTKNGSSIKEVKDLKGKKVAATFGTDPHIFLLRSLYEAKLKPSDVEIINLQHTNGAQALATGQVDAWAGLDPNMAKSELEANTHIFSRNPSYNTFSVLNVRSDFAKQYPAYVEKIIALYEKARKYTVEHPDEAIKILAKSANLSEQVAKKEFDRTDFSQSIPGDQLKNALLPAAGILQEAKIISPSLNKEKLINDLIQPSYAKKVIQ